EVVLGPIVASPPRPVPDEPAARPAGHTPSIFHPVHPAEARAGLEKCGDADSTGSCVHGLQNREVSMSTSLLDQAFGIRGYESIRTDYRGGQTLFTIRQDPDDCRCSACGSRAVISRGHCQRQFLTLPIGSRKTSVVLP